jgi:putative heme-binding domain-containing protein
LASYDQDRIPDALIGSFGGSISAEDQLRETAYRTLATRKSWARKLLREFTEWRLHREEMPADVLQRLRTYDDDQIVSAVEEVFGKPVAISAPEKLARIERLTELLDNSAGDANAGKAHFIKNCAICHKLFGEGKQIGPPLDTYDRGNLKFWLPAVVEPSLQIREGYESYAAHTNDGRTITGMLAAEDAKSVTIRTADDQLMVLDRGELEDLQAIKTSLMPEDTLKELSDEQIRDLFAYLSLGVR